MCGHTIEETKVVGGVIRHLPLDQTPEIVVMTGKSGLAWLAGRPIGSLV